MCQNTNLAFLINSIFSFLFFKILNQNDISGMFNLYNSSNETKIENDFDEEYIIKNKK